MPTRARVAELVRRYWLKTNCPSGRVGSSPTPGIRPAQLPTVGQIERIARNARTELVAAEGAAADLSDWGHALVLACLQPCTRPVAERPVDEIALAYAAAPVLYGLTPINTAISSHFQ